MTFRTLIFRSLRFHWRSHLGVVLGAAVGSAALIGALIVGDSVRGSLREMALQRLGWVHLAMAPTDRFFTSGLAERLDDVTHYSLTFSIDNGLRLFGTAAREDGTARANQVNVLGMDWLFWQHQGRPQWFPAEIRKKPLPLSFDSNYRANVKASFANIMPSNGVVLNEALASQLQAKVGDEIILRIAKPSAFSREVPVATQIDANIALRLKVYAIAKGSELGNFSLQPSQAPPLNAFVRVDELQRLLDIAGKANLLLVGEVVELPTLVRIRPALWAHLLDVMDLPESVSRLMPKVLRRYHQSDKPAAMPDQLGAQRLNSWVFFHATRLEDAEVELHPLTNADVLELRSSRIFLEPPVAKAVEKLNRPVPHRRSEILITNGQPVLTYIVNQFRSDTNTTPYSMITAAGQPWTPSDMKDDEILVNQWLAEDLHVRPGETVELAYFLPESAANLVEATNRYRVRAVVPLDGIYADRTLMPDFPGIAKAESTHNWEAGFPLVHKIRDKDEDYWKKYRGTPKAFVTLAAGQKMWGNRFGNLTAIRWPVPASMSAGQFQAALQSNLLARLNPAELGLRFEPVRAQALAAANQAQDFGQLFLGFSFFLILAALILMALLFQFGLEQRMTEVGTLLAVGFTPRQVRRLFLWEAAALAFLGGLIGVLGGAGYAWAMLKGLTGIWRETVHTSALSFHASASTICIGLLASTVVSTLTIAVVLRKAAKRPGRELLLEGAEVRGERGEGRREKGKGRISASGWMAGTALGLASALVIYPLARGETAPGLFFGSGALLLMAGLAFSAVFLARLSGSANRHLFTISSLGVRGCTRRRKRSLATVALLACGSFIIVAVGANRLEAGRDAQERSSGTGGFALIGQSTLPVVHDLNSERGRDFYGLDAQAMAGVQVVPFRVREGDDASCLNLNRAQKPRVLGVDPQLLAQRKAFTFAKVMKGLSVNEGWNLLSKNQNLSPLEIPAIGDQNSILWAMGKKVGDTIDYVDEHGQPFRARLVGAVANSILQGSLLISEENFRARFPSETGYRMFLMDAPSNQVAAVSATLTRALQDVGLELTPAAQRLAEFNAVQNTYLNTFQVLGGLGLLLGSAGLGLVVLRNVLERRGELALLQAVGFRRRTLQWLVLSEHGGLLWMGLGIGIVAAMVAILPVLLSPGGEIHYVSLSVTLAAVFLNGMAWTWLATRWALRGELLPALRNE